MKFISGYNMPGYMPDNCPNEFDNLEEAKDDLSFWMLQYVECMADCGESMEEEEAILIEFEKAEPQTCQVRLGDFVFWITDDRPT